MLNQKESKSDAIIHHCSQSRREREREAGRQGTGEKEREEGKERHRLCLLD